MTRKAIGLVSALALAAAMGLSALIILLGTAMATGMLDPGRWLIRMRSHRP